MLFNLFYEIALGILTTLALPKMLYLKFFKGKYKNSFKQRFGYNFPTINKGNRPLVWIHAVSVGETRAIAKLAKQIKDELNCLLVISTITETGQEEAKRSLPFADVITYLPYDFIWSVNRILNAAQPDHVILCETDFWYNFLRNAKERGATLSVVNAKISERSFNRFKKFPWISHHLFRLLDLVCTQNTLYKERFVDLGVNPDKVVTTGNLKFDESFPKTNAEEIKKLKEKLGVKNGDFVVTIGSTHNPEEENLLKECKKVWEVYPTLKVLLVPRHPERFDEVAEIIKKQNIHFQRYSTQDNSDSSAQVILIDTMGQLRNCYQISTIAIVAGSYTEAVGGHNILEPMGYTIPTLFGPFMHSQPDLLQLATDSHAGLQVSLNALASTVVDLLKHPEKRIIINEHSEALLKAIQGTTEKTFQELQKILKK